MSEGEHVGEFKGESGVGGDRADTDSGAMERNVRSPSIVCESTCCRVGMSRLGCHVLNGLQ
jgi:hypothetical protein